MRLTRFPSPMAARISARLSVTICFDESGLQAEWRPRVPKRLTPAELAAYRSARAELMREVARLNGLELVQISADVVGLGRRTAA